MVPRTKDEVQEVPGRLALRTEMIPAHRAVSQVVVGALCDPTLDDIFSQISVCEIHEPAIPATLSSVSTEREFADFVSEAPKEASNALVNTVFVSRRARVVDCHGEGLHSRAVR